MKWTRTNPIWFEAPPSSAFNPAYVFLGVGVVVMCAAVLLALLLKLGPLIQVASISSLTVTVNILAMCATTENKAKIIGTATSSGEIAKGIVSGLRPFGGKADCGDVE